MRSVDGNHDVVAGRAAGAILESLELGVRVDPLLGPKCRVAGRAVAAALRTVAGDAGRNAAGRVAAAVTASRPVFQFEGSASRPGGRLLGEMRAQILHVLLGQRHRHRRHECIGALAFLECLELRDDVSLGLAGEARPFGIDAVARHAMAGAADGGLLGALRGVAGVGGTRRDHEQARNRADPGFVHERIIYVPVFKGPIPEKRHGRGLLRRRFRVRSRDRGSLQQREVERAQCHRPAIRASPARAGPRGARRPSTCSSSSPVGGSWTCPDMATRTFPAAVQRGLGAAHGRVFRGAPVPVRAPHRGGCAPRLRGERRGDARLCARPRHPVTRPAQQVRQAGAQRRAQALATARRVLAGRAGVQLFSAESGEGVECGAGRARGDAGRPRKNARRSIRTAGLIPGLGMQSGRPAQGGKRGASHGARSVR